MFRTVWIPVPVTISGMIGFMFGGYAVHDGFMMTGRIGPSSCWCCDAEYSTSGCLRGPRCECLFKSQCKECGFCELHHAAECSAGKAETP